MPEEATTREDLQRWGQPFFLLQQAWLFCFLWENWHSGYVQVPELALEGTGGSTSADNSSPSSSRKWKRGFGPGPGDLGMGRAGGIPSLSHKRMVRSVSRGVTAVFRGTRQTAGE